MLCIHFVFPHGKNKLKTYVELGEYYAAGWVEYNAVVAAMLNESSYGVNLKFKFPSLIKQKEGKVRKKRCTFCDLNGWLTGWFFSATLRVEINETAKAKCLTLK